MAFLNAPLHTDPNQVIIRVERDSGVRMTLLSRGPNGRASKDVHLDLSFVAELGTPLGAHERLFHDAINGHQSRFTRRGCQRRDVAGLAATDRPTALDRELQTRVVRDQRVPTTSCGVIRHGKCDGSQPRDPGIHNEASYRK